MKLAARRRQGAQRRAGWLRGARRVDSPNHGARPRGIDVSLLVVHSISVPAGHYGGDAVERLFTNRLDPDAHPGFAALRGLTVSAHVVIARDGALTQYVSLDRRAWHAGRSHWLGRDDCNDWSVGVELEGLEGHRFTPRQYASLARLLRQLARRLPLRHVAGHEHVAPGRKHDPGAQFDWARLARSARGLAITFPPAIEVSPA